MPRAKDSEEMVFIDSAILRRTEKAILVANQKDEEVWIPLSQCELADDGTLDNFLCKRWIAEEKELV